jgi:hypothetical protein
MTFKTEFPADFWLTDEEVATLTAAGFVDDSWHNDASPSFRMVYDENYPDNCVTIYADAADPEAREMGGKRFMVVGYQDGCPEPVLNDVNDPETCAEFDATFDTLQEAIDCATEYAADCFHVLNR